MGRVSEWMLRNDRRIEWGFFALFAALLVYAIADVARVFPWEQGWHPRSSVVMGAGLLLQPTAALVGRRSRPLQFTLLALSLVLLTGGLLMAS